MRRDLETAVRSAHVQRALAQSGCAEGDRLVGNDLPAGDHVQNAMAVQAQGYAVRRPFRAVAAYCDRARFIGDSL
ncbi:hypothetical protein D3C80_1739460 [compost metagenome]